MLGFNTVIRNEKGQMDPLGQRILARLPPPPPPFVIGLPQQDAQNLFHTVLLDLLQYAHAGI